MSSWLERILVYNFTVSYNLHYQVIAERLSVRLIIVQGSQFTFVCIYVYMYVCMYVCISVTLSMGSLVTRVQT